MNKYLKWLSSETESVWWHDSADIDELKVALEAGAVGVTTNPVLVRQAIYAKPDFWKPYLAGMPKDIAGTEKTLEIIRRVTVQVAKILEPIYHESNGKNGYVCAQVAPSACANREEMVRMVRQLHSWAPNIAVKIPVTAAGLDVLEQCVAEGITITATVSFTLPQALEIGRRHQLGVEKARKGGIEPGRCFAVVMVGRIDDYIRDVIHDNRIEGVEESDIIQIGTLIMKRALAIYKERGYEAVMMPAGMRGAYHAMDLSGAPIAMSIHPKIQAQLGKQAAPFATRQALEVAPDVIKRLEQVEECRRAIDPEGMVANDFISYGVVQKTLAQFTENWSLIESYQL